MILQLEKGYREDSWAAKQISGKSQYSICALKMAATEAPAVPNTSGAVEKDMHTNLSTQYDTPMGLAHTTMQALKERITQHYDLASDYYLNLW